MSVRILYKWFGVTFALPNVGEKKIARRQEHSKKAIRFDLDTGEPLPAETGFAQLAQELVEAALGQGIELTGPDGLLTGLTRQVLQTALEVEMADDPGYEKNDPAGSNRLNSRNGSTPKTLRMEISEVTVQVPEDPQVKFEPDRARGPAPDRGDRRGRDLAQCEADHDRRDPKSYCRDLCAGDPPRPGVEGHRPCADRHALLAATPLGSRAVSGRRCESSRRRFPCPVAELTAPALT